MGGRRVLGKSSDTTLIFEFVYSGWNGSFASFWKLGIEDVVDEVMHVMWED